jgi:hypothetical protein
MPNQREHRGHRDQLISFLISSVFSVSSVVKMPDGCRIEMGAGSGSSDYVADCKAIML